MKPNVFIIFASRILSGPGKGLFQFIRHAKAGHGFDYVLANFTNNIGCKSEFAEVAEKEGANYRLLYQKAMLDPALIKQALKLYRDEKCNIIQTHGYKGHVIAYVLSRLFGFKWIAWAHGWTNENAKVRFYNKIERFCLKRADIAVAVSPKLYDRISSFRGVKKRTSMILNAVEEGELPGEIGGAATRIKHGFNSDDLVLGCFGRLSPEKGQEVLLEAFARVTPKHSKVKVMLVGDGQEGVSLKALAERLGISNQVVFCGYQRAMQDYYEAVDIVVMPSHSEGLPNVVLEAQAARKPVIVTDVGGVREIVEDGVNGRVVPAGDRLALAEAISAVVSSRQLCAQYAKKGYEMLYPKFSPAQRAKKITTLYQELLENG
ncbi:MAG: glycosyltransferase family 4 protein [Gammaproteobacteria bacterium]|nr:glycosyltransferase family 4 protein [Gammaproteobacteria bacterium]